MDRFIVHPILNTTVFLKNLKSNMDRFIAAASSVTGKQVYLFKIQYG